MIKTNYIIKLLKFITICTILILPYKTYAQVSNDKIVPEKHIYKTRGLSRLRLYIFQPTSKDTHENSPTIIFFHGGGLRERMTWEFVPQAKYLVERGMVAVLATLYRASWQN